MTIFKKRKSIFQLDDKLLAMAKLYTASNSIDEFLVLVDLHINEVPYYRWSNPFVILDALKNKRTKRLFSICFPIAIFAGGFSTWLPFMPIWANIIAVLVQFSIVGLQMFIDYRASLARQALCQVEYDALLSKQTMYVQICKGKTIWHRKTYKTLPTT